MKKLFKQIIVSILTFEASLILKRYKPKIVVVTGSVGKTSTKEAIATVLEKEFKIRKSQKSYNSEIGVPLVILGGKSGWLNPFLWGFNILKGLIVLLFNFNYPEWLVLEMGVERPGDMRKLAKWVKPDIVVVTALADIPAHVEFFANPKELIREKSQILKVLKTEDSAVLNKDDIVVYKFKEKTKAKIISYGFSPDADLIASNYSLGKDGIFFNVDHDGSSIPMRIAHVFGKHHVYPILASFAVGKIVDLNLVEMSEAFVDYETPAGRMRVLAGIKNSMILDDTYNSSPIALRAALEALQEVSATRKIAVLGDMLELGKYTIEAHQAMAKHIIDAGVEKVFAIGPRAKFITQSLRDKNYNKENIFEFSTSDEAKKKVQEIIEEGDVVLVKGSQGMRMERIVEEIMAEPERKEELLVRQEKAWLNKK